MPKYTCGRSGGRSGPSHLTNFPGDRVSALKSRAKAKQITLNPDLLEKAWGRTSGNVALCRGTWPWELGREGMEGKAHGFTGFPLATSVR